MKPPIKYLSLFSGIGGFELGIGDKGECIGYSETNKYAVQVYGRHFNHNGLGDVTKIDAKSLPDFDLLVGGFPCQAFSVAGKRGGFKDTRGTLFFEIARIVREKQPRLLLLENVKGLLSHDKGRTFLTIITALDELGYDCQWQVLNSKNFGVPQNRERVFIVGHLRGTRRPEVFPLGQDSEADNVVPTLTARYYGARANGAYLRQVSPKGGAQGMRVYDPKGIAVTIASQAGGLGAKTGLYFVGGLDGKKWLENGKTLSRNYKQGQRVYDAKGNASSLSAAGVGGSGGHTGPYLMQRPHGFNKGGKKEIAPALSRSAYEHNNHLVDGERVRRLTPTECERTQGFPDGWTEGLSDNQRYKCLGNAVTVNVIRAILEKLFKIDLT